MTKSGRKLELVISLVVGVAIASFGNCALAQVIRDNTLGTESSIVTVSGNSYVINGGARRGLNLFHSFDKFSLFNQAIAQFNNASDIQNIISRVTGSSISNIDGTISAIGNANLFLLNPNGILFGSNAALDIGGSFIATTASSIKFADNTQFSAINPQAPPLLIVSVPVGLQFNRTAAINIQNSTLINKNPSKTLAFLGGDINLTGNLIAPEGRIELGSVGDSSLVSLNPTDKGWELGYENVQNFKDIKIDQNTRIIAVGEGGGDIQLQGKDIRLSDTSQIFAISLGSKQGGTLTLNASELVELVGIPNQEPNEPQTGLFTTAVASGSAGNTRINTRRLIVRDGAIISTDSGALGSGQVTPATGRGGNLVINASESVELINGGKLLSNTNGLADAGNVRIKTGRLLVQGEGSEISVSSAGRANAGNINITADSIYLNNSAVMSAQTASGKGGNIRLEVQDLRLRHGSNISTSAGGTGNGGNIKIDTDLLVALEDSNITANAVEGTGGNITINTEGIFLSPDSHITASSELGIDGMVEINALDIDPARGLLNLPTQLVDASRQIAQGCGGNTSNVATLGNQFIITGRGGLPPNPREAFGSSEALADLGTTTTTQENRASNVISSPSSSSAAIVEAQGWVIDANGEVVLTATAPNVTPNVSGLMAATCQNRG